MFNILIWEDSGGCQELIWVHSGNHRRRRGWFGRKQRAISSLRISNVMQASYRFHHCFWQLRADSGNHARRLNMGKTLTEWVKVISFNLLHGSSYLFIEPKSVSLSGVNFSDQLMLMKIKGSAFLWHQVRCMVAVLFLVGEGLESLNVIDVLLDVDKTPKKPQYKMAPEVPLVLQSCEFEGLNFKCSSDARRALQLHLEKECRAYKLQASIFQEALLSLLSTKDDDSITSNKTKKKVSSHVPLMSRPTEPSYDERRMKLTFSGAAQHKSVVAKQDMRPL